MKNKVYVLFQTDIWKTKSSRVCFGVFLYENAAIDAAKENGLYTNESEVDIIAVSYTHLTLPTKRIV